jgi:hypothetical protein
MLAASEFQVGCLADASGLTLMLPRSKSEHLCLVASMRDSRMAICLDGQHAFVCFECSDNTAWKGILVPGVEIEMDENSAFDPDGYYPLPGTLVRRGKELFVIGKEDGGFRTSTSVPLLADLPPCKEGTAVGFRRWQIVIGHDESRRALKTIEIKQSLTD